MNDKFYNNLKDDLKPYYSKGDCCSWIVELRKENNKLQSNWNSLREWLEKQKEDSKICKEWNRKNNFNDIDYDRDIKRFDFVLDKINELEKRNEN